MPYVINHVHIRAADPHASAAWYEKYFEAKKVSEREVMPGTITIGMEVGGPTRLNVSSKPPVHPTSAPRPNLTAWAWSISAFMWMIWRLSWPSLKPTAFV